MLARLNAVKDRLFPAFIMAGLLFFVPGVFALGLGEIMLTSRLNEPLDADLQLLDTAGLDENQIVIELGSQADYDRAGLERPSFLAGIEFDMELAGDTGTVRLTTTENVVEPFLNLIVSARWPNGRLLREYTLLVDLPAFTDTPATQPGLPVAPGETAGEAADQTAAESSDDTAEAPTIPDPDEGASSQQSAEAYTVEPGDSLWEIAEEVRPDDSVTVEQTMLAIQRNNQDAFLDNNINRVITGRVLRIPALQEIQVVDQAVAITEVNLQNSQLGVQPLAGGGNNEGTGPLEDELSVLTNDPEAITDGSGDLAATIAALENELLISEENLDRARLENQELNARLSSLEEEIDLLESIVALEDQRIAQLQAELATQSAATADALAEAQQAVDELNALENEPATPQGLLAQALEILQNNLVWIAGMAVLVLAAVGFLVFRSRREDDDADEYAFDPGIPASSAARNGTRVATAETHVDASPAKAGMFGSMMGPFRRHDNDADGIEDEIDDDIYAGSGLAGPSGGLPDDARVVPAEDFSAAHNAVPDDEYDTLLNDSDSDESRYRDAAGNANGTGAFTVLDDDSYPEQEFNNIPDDTARADASDIAAAAAAMAAMDAEAEQAAERDLTDADAAEMARATEEPESTGLANESVRDHTGEAIAFTVSRSEDNIADEDDESELDTSDMDEDDESFEFTLREPDVDETPAGADSNNQDAEETFAGADSADPNTDEPSAAADSANRDADAIEKFDFKLQDTDIPEDGSVAAAHVTGQSTESDPLPELGELNFDDSMLPDEENDDYLAHHDLDECDTKLDLATAYEAMGDVEDAIEILNEVIAEGNEKQIETAERLKQGWQSA